jgi:hypothetical protein
MIKCFRCGKKFKKLKQMLKHDHGAYEESIPDRFMKPKVRLEMYFYKRDREGLFKMIVKNLKALKTKKNVKAFKGKVDVPVS